VADDAHVARVAPSEEHALENDREKEREFVVRRFPVSIIFPS